jgi:hypothetical protein
MEHRWNCLSTVEGDARPVNVFVSGRHLEWRRIRTAILFFAQRLVERYQSEPFRGYGAGARRLLEDVASGGCWNTLSKQMFGGSGSRGNGAAMRVSPLGAWFADDVELTIKQAALSAEVTHTHPEAQLVVARRHDITSTQPARERMRRAHRHVGEHTCRRHNSFRAE